MTFRQVRAGSELNFESTILFDDPSAEQEATAELAGRTVELDQRHGLAGEAEFHTTDRGLLIADVDLDPQFYEYEISAWFDSYSHDLSAAEINTLIRDTENDVSQAVIETIRYFVPMRRAAIGKVDTIASYQTEHYLEEMYQQELSDRGVMGGRTADISGRESLLSHAHEWVVELRQQVANDLEFAGHDVRTVDEMGVVLESGHTLDVSLRQKAPQMGPLDVFIFDPNNNPVVDESYGLDIPMERMAEIVVDLFENDVV